jgi:hypothetical protein
MVEAGPHPAAGQPRRWRGCQGVKRLYRRLAPTGNRKARAAAAAGPHPHAPRAAAGGQRRRARLRAPLTSTRPRPRPRLVDPLQPSRPRDAHACFCRRRGLRHGGAGDRQRRAAGQPGVCGRPHLGRRDRGRRRGGVGAAPAGPLLRGRLVARGRSRGGRGAPSARPGRPFHVAAPASRPCRRQVHLPRVVGMLLAGMLLENVPRSPVAAALPLEWGSQIRAAGLATIYLRCGLVLEWKVTGHGRGCSRGRRPKGPDPASTCEGPPPAANAPRAAHPQTIARYKIPAAKLAVIPGMVEMCYAAGLGVAVFRMPFLLALTMGSLLQVRGGGGRRAQRRRGPLVGWRAAGRARHSLEVGPAAHAQRCDPSPAQCQAVGPALLVPLLFGFQQQRLGTHEGAAPRPTVLGARSHGRSRLDGGPRSGFRAPPALCTIQAATTALQSVPMQARPRRRSCLPPLTTSSPSPGSRSSRASQSPARATSAGRRAGQGGEGGRQRGM